MDRLILRPLRVTDEEPALEAHDAMVGEGFDFLLGWDRTSSFEEYVELLSMQERGEGLEGHQVPATFRVAEVHGVIVGRTHIRHRLNERLRREGGHVGFGVLPAHRRRGYATRILELSLQSAQDLGIERALVTCADDNLASQAVIERCGGELDDTVPRQGGGSTRRYWIGTRSQSRRPPTR